MASIHPGSITALRQRSDTILAAGVTLVMIAVIGSGLLGAFLFPYLQFYLLVYSIPAVLVGLLGEWRRSWILTLSLTITCLVAYIVHNIQTSPYGYQAVFDMYIRGQPAPFGLNYYHSWFQLRDVTILVLCPGVAITVHALIERRRYSKLESASLSARCERCNYLLRGLVENRCPECGLHFDSERVSKALLVSDGLES